MSKPYIPILLGSSRPDCYSSKVARYVNNTLKENKRAEVDLHTPGEFIQEMTIPPWQEEYADETKDWRDIAEKAVAFIIVAPEYNHGYPGELKIVLDEELENYKGKPVLTCGVSAGNFGGARMVEHILMVYNELGLVNVPYPVYFSNVHELFDEKDKKQRDDKFKERVEKSFDKLLTYQEHLENLHEDIA
ncbi:MAG: NADPH-dependent FMN reductase [Candidatus Paceibacteria bacterium]